MQEFAGTGTCYLFALFPSCLLFSHVKGFFSSLLFSVLNGCSVPMYHYPPIKSRFNKQTIITCFTERNETKTIQMRLYPEILLKAPGQRACGDLQKTELSCIHSARKPGPGRSLVSI